MKRHPYALSEPLTRNVIEVKLMLIAAVNRTTEDTPAQARSCCERLVWVPFVDVKFDKGLLDGHVVPYNFRER